MARHDRPPYQPGDLVAGKYVIRRVLGEGGMAVVYGALDTTCDRQVALKILRPGVARQRALSAEHLQREAATAVRLHERTPHVVEVLTAGITDDAHRLPYYVMERLYGASLRAGIEEKRLQGQPFEIIEVASTVTEIAMPLAFAHQLGIVHRDVKPENVYLAEQRDSAYIVKLLDFGISALVEDEAAPARKRSFSGSRPYAAPEQLDGSAPTPAADVYSLGLILFEMLTFTLPHDRHSKDLTVAETALNALRMPTPELETFRSDVPPRLETLVSRCLANRPEDRPTALQVANELRDVKRAFERNLLGTDEAFVTDVTGPPVAVLAQRQDYTTGEGSFQAPQRFGAAVPVDLRAKTQPPGVAVTAVLPLDHEVFFMEAGGDAAGDRDKPDPTPQAFGAKPPPAPLPPDAITQPVLMVAAVTEVLPPPKPLPVAPSSPEATAPFPAQPAAVPAVTVRVAPPFRPEPAPAAPLVVIPPWPGTPVHTTNHSVDGVALRTQPEPAERRRRGVHPTALWMLLASCVVAMATVAVTPELLARRAAARAAASARALGASVESGLPAVGVDAPAIPPPEPSLSTSATAPPPHALPPAASGTAARKPSVAPGASIDPEFKQQFR
jgi:tRNA A-37 threonylcarbamoyl transferase component Bud32